MKQSKQLHLSPNISVYDTAELYGEKGSFRVLQFADEAVQGAIDLNNPKRIVFEYPRAIIHLMELNNPSFEDAFMIGHGIGTIASYFSEKRMKIVEIDSEVAELSRKFFGYGSDNVIIGDGRHILECEDTHSYDYIIVDAFTDKGTPQHLTSKPFFEITKEKLNSQGSIIMNLMGRGSNDRHIAAIHTTLGEVYRYTQSFSLPQGEAKDIQNIMMAGSNKPITFQARHMAGFIGMELAQGHIIMDSTP